VRSLTTRKQAIERRSRDQRLVPHPHGPIRPAGVQRCANFLGLDTPCNAFGNCTQNGISS
jgi:hypothetical protein